MFACVMCVLLHVPLMLHLHDVTQYKTQNADKMWSPITRNYCEFLEWSMCEAMDIFCTAWKEVRAPFHWTGL
jgi:hypothetical protein